MMNIRTGIFGSLGGPAIDQLVPHGSSQDATYFIIRSAVAQMISKAIFIVGIEAVPDTSVCRYADTITIFTEASSV